MLITTDEKHVELLKNHCEALRNHAKVLGKIGRASMHPVVARATNLLLEIKGKLMKKERDLFEAVERDYAKLEHEHAKLLAFCQAHGLKNQADRLLAPAKPVALSRSRSNRWN